MKFSQHYIDKSFATTVVIKRIGTRNNNPLVEVVSGASEYSEYELEHNSIKATSK